jgi:hypothetical protein
MLQYPLQIRNGTQFRTNPITGTQSRVNPSRALRPFASTGLKSNEDIEAGEDHIDGLKHLSRFDLELLSFLVNTGINKDQLGLYFPSYFNHHSRVIRGLFGDEKDGGSEQTEKTEKTEKTKKTEKNDLFPIPILQFYPIESNPSNPIIPPSLQAIIKNSFKTNPFAPVEKLVQNVGFLEETLLDKISHEKISNLCEQTEEKSIEQDENKQNISKTVPRYVNYRNYKELLNYQPLSYVYQHYLYNELIVKNQGKTNQTEKYKLFPLYFLDPHDQKSEQQSEKSSPPGFISPNHINQPSSSPSTSSMTPFDGNWIRECIMSPTGQVWGLFLTETQFSALFTKSPHSSSPHSSSPRLISIQNLDSTPCKLIQSCQVQFNVLSHGEATLFYNKFPFAQFHSVVTLNQAQFVHIKDFSWQTLYSSLYLAGGFFNAVGDNFSQLVTHKDCDETLTITPTIQESGEINYDINSHHQITFPEGSGMNGQDQAFLFPTLIWNYMPTSAGSLIHPHWQCFIEDMGCPLLYNTAKNSFKYRKQQYKTTGINSVYDIKKVPPSSPRTRPILHPCEIDYSSRYNLTKAVLSFEFQLFCKHDYSATPLTLDELSNPKTLIQQTRYIATIPIGCDCSNCMGLKIHILAPFAPQMNNEVAVYIANLDNSSSYCPPSPNPSRYISTSQKGHVSSIGEISCYNMQNAVAKAFYIILQIYHKSGILAFNMSALSAPLQNSNGLSIVHDFIINGDVKQIENDQSLYDDNEDDLNKYASILPQDEWVVNSALPPKYVDYNDIVLSFTFVSRPLPSGLYTNDTGPLERILHSNVVATPPEVISQNFQQIIKELGLMGHI